MILLTLLNLVLLIYFTPAVTKDLMEQQDPPVSKRYRQVTVYIWYALVPTLTYAFQDYSAILTATIFWFWLQAISYPTKDNP
jgi:hypothetical protein